MHDQAASLRQLVRQTIDADPSLRPGAQAIAVSGAHPGVGGSLLTAHLGCELARLGKRVLVVDVDMRNPRQAEHLGVAPVGTLSEVLQGTRRIVEQLTPVGDNIQLLAGCRDAEPRPLGGEALERLLVELTGVSRQLDTILVDAGSQMNPWTERLWRHCHQILMVCTPRREAVTEAYAAVKLAHSPELDDKLRLVVRDCTDAGEADAIAKRFADTCSRFLNLPLRRHALAPSFDGAGSTAEEAQEHFGRAIRMLAADILSDVRCAALHSLRRSHSWDAPATPTLGPDRQNSAQLDRSMTPALADDVAPGSANRRDAEAYQQSDGED